MRNSILILLFLVVYSNAAIGQLSGSYSIGGTSPDYSTINSAITALKNAGLNGPVTFKLRSGTYNEQVALVPFTGSSISNTVTIEADTGGSTLPKIIFKGTLSRNYILHIGGVSNLKFKNLEFESLDTNYSRNILLDGTCQNIHFDGCSFVGSIKYSNNINCHLIDNVAGSLNLISNSSIKNCSFFGGSASVYWNGDGNNKEQGNAFSNNELSNFGNHGFYFQNQESVIVSNNQISTSSNYRSVFGVYLLYSDLQNKIYNNKIQLNGSSNSNFGLFLSNCIGTSSAKGAIFNNFISITNKNPNLFFAGGGTGLYSNSNEYLQVYHNSIHIGAGSRGGFGMYLFRSVGGNKKHYVYVQNNSIQVLGDRAVAMSISNFGYSGIVLVVNHNNYNVPNSIFIGRWQTNLIGTLADWRSITNLDANTITEDPVYYSDSNLHINSVALNGKATTVSGVVNDIDGDVRNNPSDIGADDADFAPIDAGIYSIETGGIICNGSNNVFATLRNFGANTITSGNINWQVSVNGGSYVTQTGFSFSGNLKSGTDTLLPLGSYTFLKTNTYSVRCYSSNPNSTSDTLSSNDTVISKINFSLVGRYTIGGSSPDFNTFNEAKDALEKRGVCSSVTFDIRPGNYPEQLNFQKAIKGTSRGSSITFRTDTTSTSGWAKLIHNSDFTIQFGGGINHILFDSLELEMTSNGNVIEFNGVNDHITFNGNKIKGYNTYTTSVSASVLYDWAGNNTTNLKFTNNYVKYGTHGIYLSGTAINNTQDTFLIENNVFDEPGVYGINLHFVRHGMVKGNRVYINAIGRDFYAVLADYVYSTDVIGNHILAQARYNGMGFWIDHFYGTPTKKSIIANNMVSMPKASTNQFNQNLFKYCFNTDIVFNSFYGKSGNAGNGLVKIEIGNNTNFQNNCVYNDGNGAALRINGTVTRNNNNLFSKWATGHVWGGAQGINGLNVDPNYASPTTGDLHITTNVLNGKGKLLNYIKDDYDQQPRDTLRPDIGADEYPKFRVTKDIEVFSVRLPKGPCYSAADTIYYFVRNEGTQSLNFGMDNYRVVLTTKGMRQRSVTKTINNGTLAPLGVSLGYILINLEDTGVHNIEMKLISSWDLDKTNDTLLAQKTIVKQTAPSYSPNEICYGDSLTIIGKAVRDTIFWYNDINLSKKVFEGDTFFIGSIIKDTSFYMIELDSNGCRSIVQETKIKVNPIPVVNISNPGRACEGNVVSRNLFANPIGGNFTGQGVSGKTFNTLGLLTGRYEIHYQYTDANQCTNSDSVFFIIDSIPKVSFDTLIPMCLKGPSIIINQGKPTGGNYFGRNIVGSTFNPSSAGNYKIKYQYSNSLGCEDSAFMTMRVDTIPRVALDDLPNLCSNDNAIVLNYGTPIGGDYSGLGVVGSAFNPDTNNLGVHQIKYQFVDGNNCSDSAFKLIRVERSPYFSLGPDIDICNDEKALLLNPFLNVLYSWSTGDTLKSIEVQKSGIFVSTATDSSTVSGCIYSDTISVSYEAICASIDANILSNQMKLYPNPTTGKVILELQNVERLKVRIKLFTAEGRLVSELSEKTLQFKQNQIQLDLSGFSEGVYLVLIENGMNKSWNKVQLLK